MEDDWISIDKFSKLVYSGYEKVYLLFKSIYLPIKDTVYLEENILLSEAIRMVSVTSYSTRVKIEFNKKYLNQFIEWTERYANGNYKLCLKQNSDNEHQWISITQIIKHQNLSRTYTYRYIDILRENETIFEQPNANVISERPYGGGTAFYINQEYLQQFLSAINSFVEQKNSEKAQKKQHKLKKLISLKQIKEQHPEISTKTIQTVAENLASSNPEIITVKNTPKRGKTLYINQEYLQQFLSALYSFIEQKNKRLISLSQIQKQHPEISRTTIKTVAENLASSDSEIITVRNTSKGGKQLYVKSEFLEQFLLKVHSNTPLWIPFTSFCNYINQTPKSVFNNFERYITATDETLSNGKPITDVIQVSKKRIKYQIDKRFMREFVEWTKEYENGLYKLTLKNSPMLTNLSNSDVPLFKRIQDYDWNSHTDTFWKEIIYIRRGEVYIKTKYMNILNALSTTPDNENISAPDALDIVLSRYTEKRTK